MLKRVSGTSLDLGVELDALAALPSQERDALVGRAGGGEQVSAVAALKAAVQAEQPAPAGEKSELPQPAGAGEDPVRQNVAAGGEGPGMLAGQTRMERRGQGAEERQRREGSQRSEIFTM